MNELTKPAIDRRLMERDLQALAGLLAPAIEARLAVVLDRLARIPVVGPKLSAQLQGSPRAMTFEAFSRLFGLTDAELVALVDALGI